MIQYESWWSNDSECFSYHAPFDQGLTNGLVRIGMNGVLFLDLKKAFDAVDHEVLLQRLKLCWVDHESLK